ncbi:hypothetical protein AMIS_13390 [Actinoplanes missouriensis 431]|uniref:Uncharacterized protein n=1 Tax=Actinoplanes missouriensis (strain ATCC 14538 / DSM 43046 / CBS 188.64 / JCM 3121 / NBRC 102363 / NCIMB 12654 / NRRL B-3342 / UNCC 431) TaxID=512565 RepID=I0H0M2_ACTM4|nr:hypothetical protein [Actinoplanes missouriensis]BAL86559.1 hypothetical protein AMIS_13390 [Actinoplanes missouriensis 431]
MAASIIYLGGALIGVFPADPRALGLALAAAIGIPVWIFSALVVVWQKVRRTRENEVENLPPEVPGVMFILIAGAGLVGNRVGGFGSIGTPSEVVLHSWWLGGFFIFGIAFGLYVLGTAVVYRRLVSQRRQLEWQLHLLESRRIRGLHWYDPGTGDVPQLVKVMPTQARRSADGVGRSN